VNNGISLGCSPSYRLALSIPSKHVRHDTKDTMRTFMWISFALHTVGAGISFVQHCKK
jgi:hypothetical protein